ncbi:MAG: glycoside hydrolase family 13 protein [Eubacteriales bacterium]|nr:glycoside hydrolase family 13 protein [Eubacteriales bacterium]
MEFSAIYHDVNKKYCYALKKGRFLIRLKVKKDDMQKVVLHYQDKYIKVEMLDTRRTVEMRKAASDCWCDYYEAEIEIDVICLRYYFELTDRAGMVSYYSNQEFFSGPVEDTDRMFDCPQNLREEEMFEIPDWAKNRIVYQIFPSRFASSKFVEEDKWYQAPIGAREDIGGDLKGIIGRLEYLRDLGVDVLYLTPVFASNSTHKYNTIDYYKIDPDFGTEEDLKNLVERAHGMGMRVILDGVFNHTSPEFFAFADLMEKQEKSAYKDWYYPDGFPLKWKWGEKPNYKSFAYFGGMPKLNLLNPETQEYFIQVGRYWIEKCKIDGWRLDVGDEISHKFWRNFRREMKALNPEALIVGEVWHCAEDFLDGEEWDSIMNYSFHFSVIDFVAKESISPSRFWGNIGYLRGNVHTKVFPVLWNLIDSHDTARFLHMCGGNKEKLKLAAALQMLLSGMPVIYYGDELGMAGGPDPDCRRGMLWDEKYQDQDVFQWYRRLIKARKEYACITEGVVTASVTDDEKGLLLITKELGDEKLAICFHAKDGEAGLPEYAGARDVLRGEVFSGFMKPYEAYVFEIKN